MGSRLLRLRHSEQPVEVFPTSGEGAVLDKAVSAIESVWLRIPSPDCERIGSYWSGSKRYSAPILFFEDPWYGGDALASCKSRGFRLKFDWPTLSLMPSHAIETVIAHELAHVFQWAIGKNRYNLSNDDLIGNIPRVDLTWISEAGRVELHADEVMTSWGFIPIEGTAWLIQHTKRRNGKVILREKPVQKKYAREEAKRRRFHRYYDGFATSAFGSVTDETSHRDAAPP